MTEIVKNWLRTQGRLKLLDGVSMEEQFCDGILLAQLMMNLDLLIDGDSIELQLCTYVERPRSKSYLQTHRPSWDVCRTFIQLRPSFIRLGLSKLYNKRTIEHVIKRKKGVIIQLLHAIYVNYNQNRLLLSHQRFNITHETMNQRHLTEALRKDTKRDVQRYDRELQLKHFKIMKELNDNDESHRNHQLDKKRMDQNLFRLVQIGLMDQRMRMKDYEDETNHMKYMDSYRKLQNMKHNDLVFQMKNKDSGMKSKLQLNQRLFHDVSQQIEQFEIDHKIIDDNDNNVITDCNSKNNDDEIINGKDEEEDETTSQISLTDGNRGVIEFKHQLMNEETQESIAYRRRIALNRRVEQRRIEMDIRRSIVESLEWNINAMNAYRDTVVHQLDYSAVEKEIQSEYWRIEQFGEIARYRGVWRQRYCNDYNDSMNRSLLLKDQSHFMLDRMALEQRVKYERVMKDHLQMLDHNDEYNDHYHYAKDIVDSIILPLVHQTIDYHSSSSSSTSSLPDLLWNSWITMLMYPQQYAWICAMQLINGDAPWNNVDFTESLYDNDNNDEFSIILKGYIELERVLYDQIIDKALDIPIQSQPRVYRNGNTLLIAVIGHRLSGKSTLSHKIASIHNLHVVNLSELLESHIKQSPNLQQSLESGQCIDDDTYVHIIIQHIQQEQQNEHKQLVNGWILDGFPWTLSQAQCLEKALTGNTVPKPKRKVNVNQLPSRNHSSAIISTSNISKRCPHGKLEGIVSSKLNDDEPSFKSALDYVVWLDRIEDVTIRALGRRIDPLSDQQYHLFDESKLPPFDEIVKERLREPHALIDDHYRLQDIDNRFVNSTAQDLIQFYQQHFNDSLIVSAQQLSNCLNSTKRPISNNSNINNNGESRDYAITMDEHEFSEKQNGDSSATDKKMDKLQETKDTTIVDMIPLTIQMRSRAPLEYVDVELCRFMYDHWIALEKSYIHRIINAQQSIVSCFEIELKHCQEMRNMFRYEFLMRDCAANDRQILLDKFLESTIHCDISLPDLRLTDDGKAESHMRVNEIMRNLNELQQRKEKEDEDEIQRWTFDLWTQQASCFRSTHYIELLQNELDRHMSIIRFIVDTMCHQNLPKSEFGKISLDPSIYALFTQSPSDMWKTSDSTPSKDLTTSSKIEKSKTNKTPEKHEERKTDPTNAPPNHARNAIFKAFELGIAAINNHQALALCCGTNALKNDNDDTDSVKMKLFDSLKEDPKVKGENAMTSRRFHQITCRALNDLNRWESDYQCQIKQMIKWTNQRQISERNTLKQLEQLLRMAIESEKPIEYRIIFKGYSIFRDTSQRIFDPKSSLSSSSVST